MFNRLPIRAISLGLAAFLLWWLWPSQGTSDKLTSSTGLEDSAPASQQLVSAIEPISLADAAASTSPAFEVLSIGSNFPVSNDSSQLAQEFERAKQLSSAGDVRAAEAAYRQLIADHPQIVEPYVNLAALYAQSKQLDLAQLTLTQGLQAHPSYATLFANLRKVLGALAANAYQEALEDNGEKIARLQLPTLEAIVVSADQDFQRRRLVALEQQLQAAQAAAVAAQAALQQASTDSGKLSALESELQSAQNTINGLQARLNEQSTLAQNLAAREQQREASLADTQQMAAEALAARELAAKELAARELAARELAAKELAAKELAAKELAAKELAAKELAAKELAAKELAAKELAAKELAASKQTNAAIALVESWAAAWSRQAVTDYVGHYTDNYTPPDSTISHREWFQQRQVRLTNKKFIQVSVSNYLVSATDRGFDVTFLQHYKSNTMDDRIRKRLNFAVNGDNWEAAKIIGETVLGR